MAVKAETYITEDIIAWIKSYGGDAYHTHGSMFQRSGEPDITGEMPYLLNPYKWIHVKWEVKTPTGKPSKLQLLRLDRYSKSGYSIGIVTCIEDCEALVEEFEQYGDNKQSWRQTYELYKTGAKTTR